jgi:hypothetical protein
MKLISSQKGEIAKLKVEQRATEKGWIVSRPVEYSRYDLVLDNNGRLYRIQVKYGDSEFSKPNGSIVVGLKKDNGKRKYRFYTELDIDAILVYIPHFEKICWFNKEHFNNKTLLTIRFSPVSKYGKGKFVRMMNDFIW